jgi:Rrf2 family nitric oxide-sensitive transcriptional repressor
MPVSIPNRPYSPMRLTSYTDYALRTLIYLGLHRDKLVTIQDIADLHGISKNHLMKVVHQLGVTGMVDTVRGRNGGLRLKREPADINLGVVVRNTETDFYMAECFDAANVGCAYSSSCALKGVLHAATAAYLAVLDRVSLADLLPSVASTAPITVETVLKMYPRRPPTPA